LSDVAVESVPSYFAYVRVAMGHALVTMLRRRRAILAGVVALVPVLVPLAMAFLSEGAFGGEGNKIFVKMIEYLYLKALVPLLALFFGAMLLGEDVENQTIPYLLTRPIPRFALVLGRFLAFVAVTAGLFIPSVFLTYTACTSLANFSFSGEGIKLMLHYDFVIVMALMGYGALCMFLGAFFKRPIIFGVMIIFPWQRLALYIPGVVDFFTIEKYVVALLPQLAEQREKIVVKTALMEFQKEQFLISAAKAGVVLACITLLLLGLTTLVIRWREYSQARAMEG
jgi:ABC-2 type transport system permease protein